MTRTRQDGFSLTELLIAMLVTLIVSGAVFALITSGQGAFRREPAITDRQQNIRVAMDLIQRDIATGGAGMPAFQQVFSPFNLPDKPQNVPLNGLGPLGVGVNGGPQRADFLEIFGNDGLCPDMAIRTNSGNNLRLWFSVPACYGEDQFVLVVFPDGTSGWGFAHEIHGSDREMVNFPPGLPPIPTSNIPGTPPWNPVPPETMQRIQLVRYEIAGEPEPGCPTCPQVPALWRSVTGGYSADNDYYPASSPQRHLGFWQLVARGVEDLQVRYHMADGRWLDTPPILATDQYPDIVKEVEVTLWARALGANLQGHVEAPGLPTSDPAYRAVRGSLTTVSVPRAALLALRNPAAGPNQWR